MSDDLGGQPFPDGEEPEYRHHGAADDEFASVVLDEDFVRSAAVHEPTAVERILAAAQSHSESETVRGFEDGYGYGPGGEGEFGADPDADGDMEAEAEEDPDDEGRFDRSDYAEFVEPADGDESVHDGLYGPYGSYSEYGQYSRHGRHGPYDPRFDVGEEHGSDYRAAPHRPRHIRMRPYRSHIRWQRPLAWLLVVMMGIGVLALALSAIYRGTSGQRQEPTPPPATTGVDSSARGPGNDHGALPPTSSKAGPPTTGLRTHKG